MGAPYTHNSNYAAGFQRDRDECGESTGPPSVGSRRRKRKLSPRQKA